jgi:ferredoxin--NADP+ reductase
MQKDAAEQLRREKYNATVVAIRNVHEDLIVMRVRPDTPRGHITPGQFTVLGLGFWEPRAPGCQPEELKPGEEVKLARRSYSISCPIYDEAGALFEDEKAGWIEFYIVLVRDTGRPEAPMLTPRLFLLKEGERLFLGEKITGHYSLEGVRPTDTVIFLSTGTGEAPHNYMLWELLRRGHTGRILSVCCVRYRRDLGYLATHEEVARRHANYTYVPMTTREGQGAKAYIQDLITSGELEGRLGAALDPASTHVFLCGNPKMIGVREKDPTTGEMSWPKPAGVIEILSGRGLRTDEPARKLRGSIHFEEYW